MLKSCYKELFVIGKFLILNDFCTCYVRSIIGATLKRRLGSWRVVAGLDMGSGCISDCLLGY